MRGEVDSNTIIVGEYSTSLSTLNMNRLSRQEINKEIVDLNKTIDQMKGIMLSEINQRQKNTIDLSCMRNIQKLNFCKHRLAWWLLGSVRGK